MKVKGQNQTKAIYTTMRTLVFWHNRKTFRLEKCLHYPTYSNIGSGIQMPDNYCMKARGANIKIKIGGKILYKIEKDSQRLWIKVDGEKGKIKPSKAKELYKSYGRISYDT